MEYSEGLALTAAAIERLLPKDLPGTSLLVAYSGGADSSLLLRFALDWGRKNGVPVAAAHVNHGIRGDEAIRDRDFCRDVADALGIPFYTEDFDVPAIARATGESLEAAARRVRYTFFEKIMRRERIPVLLTAHNADDQLETLLFRLARGVGPAGFCGIPEIRRLNEGGGAVSPQSGHKPCKNSFSSPFCEDNGTSEDDILPLYVIRPLLSMAKREILDVCNDAGIAYVTDSTNKDVSIARNRIRHRIIPELEALFDRPQAAAARFCAAQTVDQVYLEGEAARILSECRTEDDGLTIAIGSLVSLPAALRRRVLRRWLLDAGLSPENEHILYVEKLIFTDKSAFDTRTYVDPPEKAGSASIPGGMTVTVCDRASRKYLTLQPTHGAATAGITAGASDDTDLSIPLATGVYPIPGVSVPMPGLFLTVQITDAADSDADPSDADPSDADASDADASCQVHTKFAVPSNENGNIYNSATARELSHATILLKESALAAPSAILPRLYFRRRRPGDTLLLRGMHRDLRKNLSETKLPPALRASLPLLILKSASDAGSLGDSEEEVLWVPCVGVRDGFSAGKQAYAPGDRIIRLSLSHQNGV